MSDVNIQDIQSDADEAGNDASSIPEFKAELRTCIICVLWLVCGFALGFLFAFRSSRSELQVDYSSGSLRTAMYVGPFLARSEPYLADPLGPIQTNARPGSKRSPRWTTAQCFYGEFQICAPPVVELLANEIVQFDSVIKLFPEALAVDLKESFLERLNSQGEESALAFLQSAASGLSAQTSPPVEIATGPVSETLVSRR